MKGLIRGAKRGVWHIPLRRGLGGVIHAYCGWVFVRPERTNEMNQPRICEKCTARQDE